MEAAATGSTGFVLPAFRAVLRSFPSRNKKILSHPSDTAFLME